MSKGISRKAEPLEKEKKRLAREGEEEKVESKIEKSIEEEEKKEEPEEKLSLEEKKKIEIKEKLLAWKPKTELGRLVKEKIITNIDELLKIGRKILEPEIVDFLIPNLQYELINIGQAKGKFGGGKRRAWRQTQKKTAEGNVPKFSTMAIVGDSNGHIGVGYGKAKETLPAREKAIRKAKLNIFRVNRGCGSFDCVCNDPHSIPLVVKGKCGSSKVILKPAPRGTGLVADDEIKKIFRLAGIKDIYVKSLGKTRTQTKFNHVKAVINALKKLNAFEVE